MTDDEPILARLHQCLEDERVREFPPGHIISERIAVLQKQVDQAQADVALASLQAIIDLCPLYATSRAVYRVSQVAHSTIRDVDRLQHQTE